MKDAQIVVEVPWRKLSMSDYGLQSIEAVDET